MKKKLSLFLVLFFISITSVFGEIKLYFSPYDDCEKIWLEVINSAQSYIYISCFGLTNPRIYDALIQKHLAGVKVLVLEDKRQSASRYDYRNKFRLNKIETIIKKIGTLEHNKMIVVDDKNAIVGSWNLSKAAQKQDNSIVLFLNEPEIAKQVKNAILRIYERDK